MEIIMKPTAESFRSELNEQLKRSEKAGKPYLDVKSGDLHKTVGGYPGSNHRMPVCCEVMYSLMHAGDEIIASPPKGRGATLIIRYFLPRNSNSTSLKFAQTEKIEIKPNTFIRLEELSTKYPELGDLKDYSHIVTINPRMAIVNTRVVAEKICRHVCGKQGTNVSGVSFHELCGVLQNLNIISKKAERYLNTIRILGNVAVHPGDKDEFVSQDAIIVGSIFTEFLNEIT
jgi:hypothetical protein